MYFHYHIHVPSFSNYLGKLIHVCRFPQPLCTINLHTINFDYVMYCAFKTRKRHGHLLFGVLKLFQHQSICITDASHVIHGPGNFSGREPDCKSYGREFDPQLRLLVYLRQQPSPNLSLFHV